MAIIIKLAINKKKVISLPIPTEEEKNQIAIIKILLININFLIQNKILQAAKPGDIISASGLRMAEPKNSSSTAESQKKQSSNKKKKSEKEGKPHAKKSPAQKQKSPPSTKNSSLPAALPNTYKRLNNRTSRQLRSIPPITAYKKTSPLDFERPPLYNSISKTPLKPTTATNSKSISNRFNL